MKNIENMQKSLKLGSLFDGSGGFPPNQANQITHRHIRIQDVGQWYCFAMRCLCDRRYCAEREVCSKLNPCKDYCGALFGRHYTSECDEKCECAKVVKENEELYRQICEKWNEYKCEDYIKVFAVDPIALKKIIATIQTHAVSIDDCAKILRIVAPLCDYMGVDGCIEYLRRAVDLRRFFL